MRHQNIIKNTKACESKRDSFYSTKFLEIRTNCQSESITKKRNSQKRIFYVLKNPHHITKFKKRSETQIKESQLIKLKRILHQLK